MIQRPTLVPALALLLGSLVVAQQPASVVRTYDLRALSMEFDEGFEETLTSWTRWDREFGEQNHAGRHVEDTGHDYVGELLDAVLGEALRDENVELWFRDSGDLVVTGSEELHAQVATTLSELRAVVARSWFLQVDLVRWDGVPPEGSLPAPVLDGDAANAFVSEARKNGATVRSWRTSVSPGRSTVLSEVRSVRYLSDYDVEIASASVQADPIPREVEVGDVVVLRMEPADGGAALDVVHRSSSLVGELERVPIDLDGQIGALGELPGGGVRPVAAPRPVEGPDYVEAPRVALRCLATEAFLPEDAAVALATSIDVPGARGAQVLVVRRVGGGVPVWSEVAVDRGRRLVAVSRFAHELPPMRARIERVDHRNHMGDEHSDHVFVELESNGGDWFASRVQDVVQRTVLAGPYVFGFVDPAWDRRALQELEALRSMRAAHAQRSLSLSLGGQAGVDVSVPVRLGGSFAASVGVARARVVDYDVEVAQGASVTDPLVAERFEGLKLVGAVLRDADDRALVEVRGGCLLAYSPDREALRRASHRGTISLDDTLRLDVASRIALAQGQFVTIGDAADGGMHLLFGLR